MNSLRRFAIVGLGNAARTIHLPALRMLPGVECVGGCDEHPTAAKFPFPVFTSVDEMLSETKPDMLIIATPPSSHFNLAKLGLLAGCHVFCEKPFTESLAEADELVALAGEMGRSLVVNSEFPWMPTHWAAKQRMNEPGFGRLQFLSIDQTFVVTAQTEDGWRGQETRRTFKEFGTHVLDLAIFFFGEAPRGLRARMPRPGGPATADLLCLVELEFSGDRYAHILLDRLARGRHRYLDLRLDGTESTIETSIGGRLQLTGGVRTTSRKPFIDLEVAFGGQARLYHGEAFEPLATAPKALFADATARLLADVIAALEAGRKPPCDAEYSRRTLALLLDCYDAAEDGRPRQYGP